MTSDEEPVRIIGGRCASRNRVRPVECLELEDILERALLAFLATLGPQGDIIEIGGG